MSNWVAEYGNKMNSAIRPPRNAPAAAWEDWRNKVGIAFHNGDNSYTYVKDSITKQMRKAQNKR